MLADPTMADIIKKYSPERVGALIMSLRAMGTLRADVSTGRGNVRHFRIYRDDAAAAEPAPEALPQPILETTPTDLFNNPFQKGNTLPI
jgi:hypothetical protein